MGPFFFFSFRGGQEACKGIEAGRVTSNLGANPRCLRAEGHYRLDSGRAAVEEAGSGDDGVG